MNTKEKMVYLFPLFVVFLLILGVYLSFWIGFVEQQETNGLLVLIYIIFHLVLVMIVWSYLKAAFTDPGGIPNHQEFLMRSPIEMDDQFVEEDLVAARPGYCRVCESSRPPRCRHCYQCQRCILRRDHHCPWIGNCVGQNNHRYFVQFLGYAAFDCVVVGVCCGIQLGGQEIGRVSTVFGCIGGSSLGFSLTGLFGFHLWLLANNYTTMDMNQVGNNVFDTKNWRKNCRSVCGKWWVAYFLPVGTGNNSILQPVRVRGLDGSSVFLCQNDEVIKL